MLNRFLLAGAVVLSSAALMVALTGSPSVPEESPPASDDAKERAEALRSLERRIEILEESERLISRRLLQVERGGASAAPGQAPVPTDVAQEVARLREEVRSLAVGEVLEEGGKDVLKEAVRTVQQELQAERSAQVQARLAERAAQSQAEQSERWKKFASEARLTYQAEQELNRQLAAEDARRRALLEEMRAGTRNPRELRRELRSAREATDQAMKPLLDENQWKQYREVRREEPFVGPRRDGP